MPSVVVFDGVCVLCSGVVRFILEHEASASLRFASIQSTAGSRLMTQFGLDPLAANTFVLVEDGRPFLRSEAAMRLARHLRAPWRWLALTRVVPRFARDWVYDLIARNRYRWFGRTEACMIPMPSVASRFLT